MTETSSGPDGDHLDRRLGLFDAVVLGLGSMIGAGIFVALAPATTAAGSWMLVGLAIAAIVAYCNATSSARLAAQYPSSGGTYVYGRERIGEFWGYLAGWGFVVGKTASCAAMALTVGVYVWPAYAHLVAVVAVVGVTAVNYVGVQKSAWLTRAIVAVVLVILIVVVVTCLTSNAADLAHLGRGRGIGGAGGILQAAGLLFFAFAGYARIATLGEEIRDPERTIPRAIPLALGITLVVYAAVALAVLSVLGDDAGATGAPLAAAVRAAGRPDVAPFVRAGAAVGALGSLLALLLGVSRTSLAMARDRHLPQRLAAIHPRYHVPHRAEVVVALFVAVVAATVDVRSAIGFSSFAVLVYYAIANASAWTLRPDERPPRRVVPVVGLVGCLALAFALPWPSVLAGAAVLAAGAIIYRVRQAAAAAAR
jgi:APA family basic amino acid/polyamine antiporter